MTLGETKNEADVTCSNKTSGDEESSFEAKSLRSKESDEPFGDESESEIKYKIMTWCGNEYVAKLPRQTNGTSQWLLMPGKVMIAETISLGILSLPSVLAEIGMVGGVILILGLGALATYTGYVIGQFKMAYPQVHNMADAGMIMLGPMGREIFGIAQMLFIVFIMGSHILTFSIMMNTLTSHATCTIAFGLAGLVVSLLCSLPRTLHKVSYMAVASFVSIIAAVLITMIGVGVERPGHNIIQATVNKSFPKAFLATINIVFAYAGHVGFFTFISEMKQPKEYTKALYLLQGANVSMYLMVAVVIYHYAGADVSSPALGSTSGILPKLAYGVAMPSIVIAGVINGHVAAKYCYVRLFRGTGKMGQRTWGSFARWAVIVTLLWSMAWVIAEAIPVFNDLLGLISALFASWFTYGLSGVFWLFLNYGRYRDNKRTLALTALNVLVFLLGLFIVSLGSFPGERRCVEEQGD
ncbi:MAG: hypothetical protein L6R35_004632 [Caloplaca aegaea]|nr:MAG: hypothetical protein L6R35_004632 [Caloplaca aegaea]